MESLHNTFADATPVTVLDNDDTAMQGEFPVIVAQGERRMQVRAYCHWTNLLGARQLPLIGDLQLDQLADIADNAVLLDFTASQDDPHITYVGARLAQECGASRKIERLAQVPSGTVMARITQQYGQILANQAPIGFEEEFVNQRLATIAYRGMLLPFAQVEGGPIAHVLGVINWKESADQALTEDLTRQLSDALAVVTQDVGKRKTASAKRAKPQWVEWADGPSAPQTASETGGEAALAGVPEDVARGMDLADWLASARELAQSAALSSERSRQLLYAALGRTYDFEVMAREDRKGLGLLLADAGLVPQARAPLLPLVKLVFGVNYDKTRLTEYATALAHARRLGLMRGELGRHLARVAGGLKGVVAEERRLRQAESPKRRREDRVFAALEQLVPQSFASLAAKGAEYTMLLARRMEDGSVMLLGEVGDDPALLTRATALL
jgi:hypothetical protein